MRATFLVLISSLAFACVPSGREGKSLGEGRDAGASTSRPLDAGVIVSDPDAGIVTEAPDAGVPEVPPDAGVPEVPPDAGPTQTPDAGDLCLEQPVKAFSPPIANVYYGTTLPTHVPLTDDQMLAIGTFNGCSGLLISPTWVLTASHCGLTTSAQFCIGTNPSNPNLCFSAARVVDNPSGDMTLVELSRDARELAPTVAPVPILHEDLDSGWLGTTAEASGYGQQEDGSFGEREFTAEPIVSISGDTLTIDGQGQRGVCFGDSGGPVFVIASDGSVRVAGDLSNGDGNCLGRDNYTRVDVYRTWIEGYVGVTQPPGPQPCGAVTVAGSCNAARTQATWCGPNDELVNETCGAQEVCAFDPSQSGYRCIPEAQDPCQGVSERGACSANVLSWCDRGVLRQRDCTVCEESCVPESREEDPSYNCIPSNCGDVDFFGRCEGSVAVWCDRDGALQRLDCGGNGQSCGFVDDATGYYCR